MLKIGGIYTYTWTRKREERCVNIILQKSTLVNDYFEICQVSFLGNNLSKETVLKTIIDKIENDLFFAHNFKVQSKKILENLSDGYLGQVTDELLEKLEKIKEEIIC